MTVTHLFLKHGHGERLEAVSTLEFGQGGLVGNVSCSPLRQVLLTSQSVTAHCRLKSGNLRENIVVDVDELYKLPSGTVVKVGQALIRLTFHCEPCRNVLSLIDFDRILHKRGVLGCFLNTGSISIRDEFSVTEQRYEPIPYEIKERVRWFLDKQGAGLAVTDLVHALGFAFILRSRDAGDFEQMAPRFLEQVSVWGIWLRGGRRTGKQTPAGCEISLFEPTAPTIGTD